MKVAIKLKVVDSKWNISRGNLSLPVLVKHYISNPSATVMVMLCVCIGNQIYGGQYEPLTIGDSVLYSSIIVTPDSAERASTIGDTKPALPSVKSAGTKEQPADSEDAPLKQTSASTGVQKGSVTVVQATVAKLRTDDATGELMYDLQWQPNRGVRHSVIMIYGNCTSNQYT